MSLEWKWPKWARNVYPATILFIGLTWLELGYGVTMSPRGTAILALAMVLMAVVPALFFERRSFCRYGCLIGRICGLYSMVAPVEVRAKDRDVCKGCSTKDCLKGNDDGYPCPTGQYLGTMDRNTYCTVCTECIKSCPHDNVGINLRPWGADLQSLRKPKKDEATLAMVLLSLTSFHGLTMTPTWTAFVASARSATGLSWLITFSLGMAVILALPAAVYLVVTLFVSRAMQPRGLLVVAEKGRWQKLASAYAYPLIPVALMYHLAHNAGHFLTEAGKLISVLSDPLGNGQDLFSTASMHIGPLAPMSVVWAVMIALVLTGHFWATRALERAHQGARGSGEVPLRARVLTAGFVLCASAANLWLLAQPMEMRTGM